MINLMETDRPEVIAVLATGKITTEHYQELYPVILGKIQDYGKVPLLLRLEKLDSSAAKRVWNVIKQDAHQIASFSRIAIVVDSIRYRLMVKMILPFIPADVRMFNLGEERAALKWLNV